jgi:ElaB/YqjD/DUF883 family membrane-anchored ribosome-binding protein
MSNGHNGHQSSRQIEEEVERTRAHMAETLDALRSRMSPGQIVDEVLGYTKGSGGSQMVRNLGRSVRDNPTPLLLMGAAVAWMMAGSSQRSWGRLGSAADSARQAGQGMAQGVAAATDAFAEKASDLRDSASSTAQDIGDAASSRMQDLRDAAYRTGDAAYRQGRDIGSSLANMMNEQPLVLGALGLALGAALGAALPQTDAENQLMGEASDTLKEQAREAAASTYETVKTAANEVAGTSDTSSTEQSDQRRRTEDFGEIEQATTTAHFGERD